MATNCKQYNVELTGDNTLTTGLGYRRNYCKSCIYKRRRPKKEERRAAYRALIYEYLQTHPCVVCGERDPIVLDFDHLGDKRIEIGRMIKQGNGLNAIIAELNKCQVLCCNCHRRKTCNQLNWYRAQWNGTGSV